MKTLLILLMLPLSTFAKLQVVATTSDLDYLINEVAGGNAVVTGFCKGSQDPHYLEAKPSYMMKTNGADLLVAIGLSLEVGWLPSIITGARNDHVTPGKVGYLEVGPLLNPIEIPKGTVTREQGDVHPEGNPHVTLDPQRAGQAAVIIAERLGKLDPEHAEIFQKRATELRTRLEQKTKIWQSRIEKTGIKKIISYHKTLNYFFERFHLEQAAMIEPKPGVPPTGPHILSVIKLAKDQKIKLILNENYFDDTAAKRIQSEIPEMKVKMVSTAVGGSPESKTLEDVYENLVLAIEGK